MSAEVLRSRKLFGKVSVIIAQMCGIGILSLALGLLSFRYYEQQSDLVRFLESEARGAELSVHLIKSLIDVSLAENLTSENLQEADKVLQTAWMSEFIQAEVHERGWMVPNHAAGDREILSQSLSQTLNIVFERSNLILDSDFETYYLADAFFSWLPRLFFQQNSLHLDLIEKKNIAIRQFSLEQFSDSVRHASIQASAQDEKSPYSPKDSFFPTDLADFSLQVQLLLHSQPSSGKFEYNLLQLRGVSQNMIAHGFSKFSQKNTARIQAKKSIALWSLALSIFLWICSLALALVSWTKLSSGDDSFMQIIQSQEQALEKSKKLATLGEISSSIGHDIANPLSIIETSIFLLERDMEGKNALSLEHIAKIRRMISRIHGITSSIKSFVGDNSVARVTPVDLSVVFEDLQLLLKNRLIESRADLILDLAEADLVVVGTEGAYVQIFVNLVNNAIDAMKNSNTKQVIVTAEKKDDFLHVQVKDSGPGIPLIIQDRIFESFFTTKASEGGTGLGLSISRKIIHSFGGQISYLGGVGGACFELKLPAAAAVTAPNDERMAA